MHDEDEDEIKEDGLELDDDELAIPPEGIEDDFEQEDPENRYH
jgi:hypothetical protein